MSSFTTLTPEPARRSCFHFLSRTELFKPGVVENKAQFKPGVVENKAQIKVRDTIDIPTGSDEPVSPGSNGVTMSSLSTARVPENDESEEVSPEIDDWSQA